MLRQTSTEDGVSPVVGVILMVAVTVILAAVIGSFVLDLGSNVQANPQAGVTFSQTAVDSAPGDDSTADGVVNVQIISLENADDVTVVGNGSITGSDSAVDVGDSLEVTNLNAGDQITVTGTLDGKEAVIQTFTAS
jgi:flagellin-like protein